ncbi:LOW QUALITY PROTEIN: hypothetical protein HID58_023108, partial [Brassica napus]
GVLRSSPSLVSIINRLFSLQSLDAGVITVHRKAVMSLRSPCSIATLVVVLFSRVPRGRCCPKRCDLSFLFTTLSTTEAHSHVISHPLSDRTTIINREPCREVKCSLSSYLCCKKSLLGYDGVISHTLSDRTTIINREPCREVKYSLSSYLCCK